MAKQTQLEKEIAAIDADIEVLQAAKARLVQQQQQAKPKARRNPLAAVTKSRDEQSE
jgi:hypothetical protein